MVQWRRADRRRAAAAAARRLDALNAALAEAEGGAAPPTRDEQAVAAAAQDSPGRHRADSVPAGRRVAATLTDRLPPGAGALRGAGAVSGHHVAVLGVVLAACLALAAWALVSGRARPVPVKAADPAPVATHGALPRDAPGDPPSDPGSTATPQATTGSGTIIVDVAGKVRHPGIVTLPLGSRVVDAVRAAGGARESVDLTSLNLARELVDGEQLLVGLAPPPVLPSAGGPATAGTSGPVALVNLNTATIVELDTLPGVGPVTAQAILDWRAANGSFSSVDELLEVDGIGEATLADLRDLVTL